MVTSQPIRRAHRFSSLGLIVACLSWTSAGAEPPAAPPSKASSASAAPGDPQQYIFQIGLYRLNQPGKQGAVGIQHFPERHPTTSASALGVPHTFGALQCEQCHVENWQRAEGELPRTIADRVIGEALSASVAEIIAEPVLSTVEGRPARLRLAGGEVEYFVRTGDGQYRLEKIEDESGIEVQLRVPETRTENETQTVTVEPFEIRITTLDRREPVEGVALPVGKPIFRTFEWDAMLTCRPGQMNAFTVDSPRQGRILVVVRLEVPAEQNEDRHGARTAAEATDAAKSDELAM